MSTDSPTVWNHPLGGVLSDDTPVPPSIEIPLADLRKLHGLLTSALIKAQPETAIVVDLVEAHDLLGAYLPPSFPVT